MPKYVNGEYDIEKAFRAIEDELIHSMIRNFKQHRAEETKEGYNWSAWQIEQLKSLEQYKKANAEKFSNRFSNINASVEELIKEARAQGESGGQYEEEGGAPAEYQRHAAVERVKADAHIAEAYGRDDDSGKHDAGEGLYERSAGERIFGDGGTAREESEHEGVQGKTDGQPPEGRR